MADKDGALGNIELSLPANAAYVSAARQTVNSIANRLGFDADEVEDVKAAVSEACIYAIRKLSQCGSENFKLVINPQHEKIEINIKCPSGNSKSLDNDYSLLLVKGLMDGFEITAEDGIINMFMYKWHKTGFLHTN